jgi:hypothetical protein
LLLLLVVVLSVVEKIENLKETEREWIRLGANR